MLHMFAASVNGQTVKYDRITSTAAHTSCLWRVVLVKPCPCTPNVARQPIRSGNYPQRTFLRCLVSEIDANVAPAVTGVPEVFPTLA